MSTDERISLIDHEIKLSGEQEKLKSEAQEGYGCVAVSDSSDRRNHENTQFRLSNLARMCCTKVRSKFKNNRCCLWSSKAVILILVWNLIISVAFKSFFDPNLYTVTIINKLLDSNYYLSVLMISG